MVRRLLAAAVLLSAAVVPAGAAPAAAEGRAEHRAEHRAERGAAGRALAACGAPTTIPASGGAPWPAGQVLAANSISTVHTAAGSAIAWLPRAFGADVVTRDPATGVDRQDRQITMAYTANTDVVGPPGGVRNAALVSADSGVSFAPAAADLPATSLGEVGNLLDGRLLAMTFIVNGALSFDGAEVTIPLILNTSADKGRTWQRLPAETRFTDTDLPANLPQRAVSAIRGVRASGRPIQMTNGTVVMPVYFTMANTSGGTVGFESVFTARPAFSGGAVDTASAWRFTMRPVTSNPTLSFGESAVVERQDGALLMVTRGNMPYGKLTYKVSATSGDTWSGIANVSFAGQPGCEVYGVSPQLALMPNGLLVLSSGRPDNWIAISTDATGTSWTREQTTYRNRPDQNWDYGSSGYTSLVPIASNQLLQFFDNCAAPNGGGRNGCVSGSGYDHDRLYRLLHRHMSALTPDLGKIDLNTKLRKGTARVTTDLTGVPPAGAVTPPTPYGAQPSAADATSTGYWSAASGAVDGSTAFWSGALSSRADGAGTYRLELDRTYRLTKIGLALLPGARATARVSTSVNGVDWTPAALGYPAGVPASAETGRIDSPGDRALRYYTLNADARHIHVTTEAASCAAVSGPTACSMINELELYSTVNSFENEPSVPHGLTDLSCVRITQPAGNGDPSRDSRYALRLKDQKDLSYCDGAGTIAKFAHTAPAAASRTLRADIHQIANTHGILFDIRGVRASDGATIAAYHLAINSGGRWAAYTDAGKWAGLGGAAVPLRAWTTFKVVAGVDGATLYTIDAAGQETLIGAAPKTAPVALSSITGYVMSSGSTDGFGDEAVFDDISFD